MVLKAFTCIFFCISVIGSSAVLAQVAPGAASSPQVLNLMPGQTYQGTVRVRNLNDEPLTAVLSQRDVLFDANGRTAAALGTNSRSNAAWLETILGNITLEAEEIRDIPFTVSVPENVVAGSYWSHIVITNDPVAQADLPVEGTEGAAVGFQTVTRYGMLIVTNVATASVGDVQFVNPDLRQEGTVVLSVDIANTSDAAQLAEVYVDLLDEAGTNVARVEFSRVALMPNVNDYLNGFTFNLGRLEPGRYVATIVADTGGSEGVFGVRYNLDINPFEDASEDTSGEDSSD